MRSIRFRTTLFLPLVASASLAVAQVQIATLIAPANGASNVDPTFPIVFVWTSVSDEQAYYLYVGTSRGAKDLVNSGETQLTRWSAAIPPLTLCYVRMWTKVTGAWYYNDTTFTTGTGTARLITPANGASNVDPSLPVQFAWTSVPTELAYYLYVGTAPGLHDVVNSGETQQTNWVASLAPLSAYYVRLWTKFSTGWSYLDSSFSTGPGIARLITPANGDSNVDPTQPVQFTWNSVPTEQAYYLYVGTAPGLHDVVNSGETQQTTWTARLSPSTVYYARIWTKLNNTWKYSDSSFATSTGLAHLSSPQNGATGVSQFVQFTWNTVSDATAYLILVSPTGFRTWDMYFDYLAPNVSGRYAWGLLPNTYYYVTLCTEKSSGEVCTYSNFTTGSSDPLPNRSAFYSQVQSLTSQVRLMTQGMSNRATPGTALYQDASDHLRDPNSITCGLYAITLLDQFTPNHILSRRRDLSLDGVDTHVITEYWDPFNHKWQIADPTFGLVYFDAQTEIGQGAEDVSALMIAGQFSDITPLWVTNGGSAYMTNYFMDPMTLYTNVYPFGNLEQHDLLANYVPNSPLPFLNPSSLGAQGTAGTYVFQFANQSDQITISNAGNNVVVVPGNRYGWAPGVTLYSGWSITSQVPPGMNMYTFRRIMF